MKFVLLLRNVFIAKKLCLKHNQKKICSFMFRPCFLCGWISCSDLFHQFLVLIFTDSNVTIPDQRYLCLCVALHCNTITSNPVFLDLLLINSTTSVSFHQQPAGFTPQPPVSRLQGILSNYQRFLWFKLQCGALSINLSWLEWNHYTTGRKYV